MTSIFSPCKCLRESSKHFPSALQNESPISFCSEPATADRWDNVGRGGRGSREGEDGVHGGELPSPLHLRRYTGAAGKYPQLGECTRWMQWQINIWFRQDWSRTSYKLFRFSPVIITTGTVPEASQTDWDGGWREIWHGDENEKV